jgi:hypothetical protein
VGERGFVKKVGGDFSKAKKQRWGNMFVHPQGKAKADIDICEDHVWWLLQKVALSWLNHTRGNNH